MRMFIIRWFYTLNHTPYSPLSCTYQNIRGHCSQSPNFSNTSSKYPWHNLGASYSISFLLIEASYSCLSPPSSQIDSIQNIWLVGNDTYHSMLSCHWVFLGCMRYLVFYTSHPFHQKLPSVSRRGNLKPQELCFYRSYQLYTKLKS